MIFASESSLRSDSMGQVGTGLPHPCPSPLSQAGQASAEPGRDSEPDCPSTNDGGRVPGPNLGGFTLFRKCAHRKLVKGEASDRAKARKSRRTSPERKTA